MRVCHVVPSLDFGGVERQLELIGRHAARARAHHAFVAVGGGGRTAAALARLGCDVAIGDAPVRIPSPAAFAFLLREFRRRRPDVVHTHGAEANLHGLLAAAAARVPVRIGEEIGVPVHSPLARRVFRHAYGTAHAVVAISRAVRDEVVRLGEAPPSRVRVVYNPVALDGVGRFAAAAAPPLRLGFVGRLFPDKNAAALIGAVRILRAEGLACDLTIVGDGPERAALDDLVARSGLSGAVRLLGYRAEPFAAMGPIHLYLQPSLAEGFGIALAEAMGAGIPVVATAVGGAPELVEHGRTGWLLGEVDADAIAAAVRTAAAAGLDGLREMGRAAARSVGGRFSPDRYLADLDALYAGLARR